MYFDGVNRGLQFTKAGFYVTGLVMLLGFVATGSGYNGFFMALGFGLSLLVVSGLLSEKAMQHAECLGLASLSAEPAQPFTVRFFIHNRSRSWHVFAIDYSVSAELPKFGLLSRKFRSLMEAHVSALGPSDRIECAGSCQGLSRGVYRDFFLVQSTLYPFGLLLKFKVQKIACRIRILPTWNAEIAAELKEKLVRQLSMGEGQEFWSHRPILPSDSLRTVDWKKSAGLAPSQWAVKVYRQNAEAPTVLLRWTEWTRTGDAADYESQLSAVRTAAETIASMGLTVLLESEPRHYHVDLESIFERLSAAPIFSKKHESPPAPVSVGPASAGARYYWSGDPEPARRPSRFFPRWAVCGRSGRRWHNRGPRFVRVPRFCEFFARLVFASRSKVIRKPATSSRRSPAFSPPSSRSVYIA